MQKISMPQPGEELELAVSDLNIDGSAVARAGGLVFFIDAGLSGELLRARVESLKKNVVMARRVETLRPSPHAVRPFCRHFGQCGGCAWQDLDYSAQLRWKHGRVQAALRRIAKVEADLPPVLPSPREQAFRNKMEYAFGPDADGVAQPGLRRRASREVCPVEACPLQAAGAGRVLQAVRAFAREQRLTPWDGRRGALRHLILRESSAPEGAAEAPESPDAKDTSVAFMAELVCGTEPLGPAQAEALYVALAPLGVKSFTVSQRLDKSPLAAGERVLRRFGAASLPGRIGPLRLEFPARGFVQTNAAAAALLYEQAAELAALGGGEVVWDVYSGVGALGLYLAGGVKAVLGVELEGEAVKMAKKNATALGYGHCDFIRGDAARVLPALPGSPDVLALDPPRAGLAAGLIAPIKDKGPSRIVYVSCDPATLARDVAALAPEYELKKIRAVDMFPHTPHTECVALLEKA